MFLQKQKRRRGLSSNHVTICLHAQKNHKILEAEGMGCSSGFGVSFYLNLRNEVVLKSPRLNTVFFEVQSTSRVRRSWQHGHCDNKKQSFLIMSLPNTEGEPHSGAQVSTLSTETNSGSLGKDANILESNYIPKSNPESDNGGGGNLLSGDGGNGKFSGGGGGGSGGNDNGSNDEEAQEFGPLLKFEEVVRETEARGASLPADMLEAAKSVGIRKVLLLGYLDLQGSVWPLGFAMKSCSMLRNRMLADPSYLFKIGTEV